MNATIYPSAHPSALLKSCHPERSLGESGANHQTQSKDPYRLDTARGSERTFRIVVRFFDEDETEHRPVPSREAAAWGSPARQCRVCEGRGTSPAEPALSKRSAPKGTALPNKRITQ